MTTLMCGPDFSTFFSTTILPITVYSGVATGTIAAITYMVGQVLANAKLTLWAKTESVQLFVSVASVFFIIFTVNAFCNLNMGEIGSLFLHPNPNPANINVYDAARSYLVGATQYSHNALTMVRYHLEAYTVLSYFNAFICDYNTGRIGWGCLFGYAGSTEQPFGGYGAQIATLNIFFNSMIMAHFTALNFLFILLYVYKGFVFLFLPLGVFVRSMPYLRTFGSLLISVALSFLVIYPFTLGVFYLMGDVLLDRGNGYAPAGINMDDYGEGVFRDAENAAAQLAVTVGGQTVAKCVYFGQEKAGCIAAATASDMLAGGLIGLGPEYFQLERLADTVAFSASAFVGAVFFPTLALLATIASISYTARLLGEEIDLSRITQLV